MYTRSYSDDRGDMMIPDSYGGTALFNHPQMRSDDAPPEDAREKNADAPFENEDAIHTSSGEDDGSGYPGSSFLSKLPISGFFSNIFKSEKFGLQKIGKEEILIIVTAAFLLFSKEGDKECAIMLLILLFI